MDTPSANTTNGKKPLLTLTLAEVPKSWRDLLEALNQTDCCQPGKIRQYILRWDGTRMVLYDGNDNLSRQL